MTGVLASQKTFRGTEPSQPGRYPAIEEIRNIFPMHPRSLNLIHYNSREMLDLGEQLIMLTAWAGKYVHGFQFNIRWPPLGQLRQFMQSRPESINVLQLGNGAMDLLERDAQKIARLASEYREVIEYVLIDSSGGRGEQLDPSFTLSLLRELRQVLPDTGLAVAGGLSAMNLGVLLPFLKEFPDISIDAEGQLRTPKPEDALDLHAADTYVAEALSLFTYRPSL